MNFTDIKNSAAVHVFKFINLYMETFLGTANSFSADQSPLLFQWKVKLK